jgi:adenosylmethionine-8-amino-7-oxononanoate aminotransferase
MSDRPNPAGTFTPKGLPKIAWGKGSYVYDTDGKQYIDGSGGPAVFCLGHSNDEVNEAVARQLDRIAHGYRYLFTSDPLEELTARIAQLTGGHFPNVVYVTGGSEAVESCLKLALQHAVAVGEPTRRRFIARRRSWHGNTLGALSVSDFAERRAAFEGALMSTRFVSAANAYRPPDDFAGGDLAQHLADELERAIEEEGADTLAGFIFEPVVGAAGGVVPAPEGYAKKVREVCDRHGVLMIADEVMCGAGRCGTWRALEHDGVVPDIMSVAKGLAGGYQPLGAALYTDRIAQTIVKAHGGPVTGHTFTGHTAACAAGCAVQEIIARDGLVERVRERGITFLEELRERLAPIEAVGDVRGRGYFIGVEFVADRETKAPCPRERMLFQKVGAAALEAGLVCYPCAGNVDGVRGDTAIIAPPYNAGDGELDEIATKFVSAVETALGRA